MHAYDFLSSASELKHNLEKIQLQLNAVLEGPVDKTKVQEMLNVVLDLSLDADKIYSDLESKANKEMHYYP